MGSYRKGAISRLLICTALVASLSACVNFDQDDIPDATRSQFYEPAEAAPPPSTAPPGAIEVLRTLSPPEGLKMTPLFTSTVSDNDARMKRLEDAVQNLRNDLDTALPVIVRSGIIDKDKVMPVQEQSLAAPVAQVASNAPIALNAPAPVPQAPAPPPEPVKKSPDISEKTTIMSPLPPWGVPPGATLPKPPEPPAPVVPPPPPTYTSTTVVNEPTRTSEPIPLAASPLPPIVVAPARQAVPSSQPVTANALSLEPLPVFPETAEALPEPVAAVDPPPPAQLVGNVLGVRVSDYPDMTRVVLDMTGKYGEEIAIANSGKTLVIPLSQFAWTGDKAVDLQSAQLVSGYRIENNTLRIDLMYPAMIKHQLVLDPTAEIRKYRLMIDLFSPDIHRS